MTWNLRGCNPAYKVVHTVSVQNKVEYCGRRYLEPTTGAATKGGIGRLSGHPGPRGDEVDSFRRHLSYGEPDAGKA